MKIPSKVKIGNLTYKVKDVPERQQDKFYGMGDMTGCTIHVRTDLPEALRADTFWHEVVHQILEQYEYRELSGDERFVSTLAMAIHQVLRDNKLLKNG